MSKALLVGIDDYDFVPLQSCVSDALEMSRLLGHHYDDQPNFDTLSLTSKGQETVTIQLLREQINQLFQSNVETALFYFAGHGKGATYDDQAYLMTEDFEENAPGISLNWLLEKANEARAREVILIVDACYSGNLGNVTRTFESRISEAALLRKEITILTATNSRQPAAETATGGRFTSLLKSGLSGGAADVLGRVTAAALYKHADQFLNLWEQRPLFKANVSKMSSLRQCKPKVERTDLRALPFIFKNGALRISKNFLAPPKTEAQQSNMHPLLDQLMRLAQAGLVKGDHSSHIYDSAIRDDTIRLTESGEYYKELAENKRI